jgi:aconitate hydratase
MIGAALLAKKAVEKGLARKPWVKTTLAPGSKVVMDYYERAGLTPTSRSSASTWSATAARPASATPARCPRRSPRRSTSNDLAVVSVLSGNRNFEGRINPDVKMNYLASPPLVVAYALAGSMDARHHQRAAGHRDGRRPVYLRDIWPSPHEIEEVVDSAIASEMFTRGYADVFAGDERWQSLPTPTGDIFEWDEDSTYVRKPPYFDGMGGARPGVGHRRGPGAGQARRLGDHRPHLPAGAIKAGQPGGGVPALARGRAARTSTPTAPGAATTR